MKIEEGLINGEVLFHEFIEKTDEEKLLVQKKREEKRFVLRILETAAPM
jgi:ribosome biogenesis protein SSF1/2